MKILNEQEIGKIESDFCSEVWGNSYNAAVYAHDATKSQMAYLSYLLRERGYEDLSYEDMRGLTKGRASALIWWLKKNE